MSPIPNKVRRLVEQFRANTVGLDPAGPAGALLPDFQSLADDYRIPLRVFNGRQRAQADVFMFDRLRDETLTHSTMIALDTAAEGANAAEKGDLWFFSRPSSYVDLSPLLACSMALWCAYETETLAPVVAIY